MNWTRAALVALLAVAAWAVWPRHDTIIDTHGPTRRFVIRATLARFDDPAVILGDSIVEGSTLPRTVCGHAVVNAGIGGLSTSSQLGALIAEALDGRRAALIVVAVGLNDAVTPNSAETFAANIRALFAELKPLSAASAIVTVPLPETGFEQANKVSREAIDAYNGVLPALAKEVQASLIVLPAMPLQHTIDGIHLNAAGYVVWDKAIMSGIEAVLCKPNAVD